MKRSLAQVSISPIVLRESFLGKNFEMALVSSKGMKPLKRWSKVNVAAVEDVGYFQHSKSCHSWEKVMVESEESLIHCSVASLLRDG